MGIYLTQQNFKFINLNLIYYSYILTNKAITINPIYFILFYFLNLENKYHKTNYIKVKLFLN